jgi:hypothetical protein
MDHKVNVSRIDLDELIEALEDDELCGFCVECGERAEMIDPDGREGLCEACGKNGVYGAAELLLWV